MCLVRANLGIQPPRGSITPSITQFLHDPLNGLCIGISRTKIPAFCVFSPVPIEPLCQKQVTSQWLQHVLPRSDSVRTPNQHQSAFLDSPDDVWNQSVFRPVAAANHITGASTS